MTIELNNPATYNVTEIVQRMSKASTVSFTVISDRVDAAVLPIRSRVRFTITNSVGVKTCFFDGFTLPANRSLSRGTDQVEYTAADVIEQLGNQPCDEVNQWYNRTSNDAGVYPYPSDYTLEQIINTELASVVGSGKLIEALDFTALGAIKDLVPREFEVKGKTFLGILDALASEVVVMGFWYDPSTLNMGVMPPTGGGTLRFYDLSAAPSSPKDVVLNDSLSDLATNCESITINEDVSACCDKLTFYGWGTFHEYRELLTPAWGSDIGEFNVLLRNNASTGALEQFSGAAWLAIPNDIAGTPWHPNSTYKQAPFGFRRYSTAHEIADLRVTKDASVSPARLIRSQQSMVVELRKYNWDTGSMVATGSDGTIWTGSFNLRTGVKEAAFTGAPESYGSVAPISPIIYEQVGPPAQTERNYLLLADHAVYKRTFNFDANISGDSGFDAVVHQNCFMYSPIGDQVWLTYTGRDDISSVQQDLSLGLSKHLKLYDVRFFKYTDIRGTVLRDDTAEIAAYAATLFAFLKRARIYGQIAIHNDARTVNSDFPMGCYVQVKNWQVADGTYAIPARVQGRRFGQLMSDWRAELEFDQPQTYTPLDLIKKFRAYFEHHQLSGETGGFKGPNANAIPGHVTTQKTREPSGKPQTPINPPIQWATPPTPATANVIDSRFVQGEITVQAGGASSNVSSTFTYKWQSLDGKIVSQAGLTPFYRPYNNEVFVIPAPVGSKCVGWLVPSGSGNQALLWSVNEKLDYQVCTTSASFVFRDGDGSLDMANVLLAVDGSPVVDINGNLVVATGTPYESAYDEMVVGSDYKLVSDVDANLMVQQQPTIEPSYFDDVVVDVSGDTFSNVLYAIPTGSAIVDDGVVAN